MLTRGEYTSKHGDLGVLCSHTKESIEIVLVRRGNVWSAFKKEQNAEYSFNNNVAKALYNSLIKKGLNGCKVKNGVAAPFVMGTVSRHSFSKAKTTYLIDKFNGELAGAEIRSDTEYLNLVYCQVDNLIPPNIPYIKLAAATEFKPSDNEEPEIVTRTLQEIALEKDISYVYNSNYYIVNDEETAEKVFDAIENWNGIVSYDTETTGLRINMFSKINSKWKKMLDEYNAGKPKSEQIRSDRLVGIILCVEEKVSYYFPCFNRKFKNLYEEVGNKTRERLIQNFKAYYTVGPGWKLQTDMARYWRETPSEKVSCDCILMERVRKILTTKNLLAHHGSFDWKVSYCYDIDMNLVEDTMIMHQLMYKFRSTTANSGEPSSLKYLSKREFNIEQLDLEDFFVDYKEDDSNEVRGSKKRGKKKRVDIDFSYMTYEGAKAYAPGDGDLTLRLCHRYKRDMLENHREMLYIYNVEIIVACAIGYMEFFGHRIDERKINRIRDKYTYDKLGIEHKVRILAGLADSEEERLLDELSNISSNMKLNTPDNEYDTLKEQADDIAKQCREHMDSKEENVSLSSPAQVARLFFEKLEYPYNGEKMSVAKKELKPLLKMKNADGTNKYPAVHLYTEWKKIDTLLTKFFDNLQNFMYPGGYIFTSYGQISTATGRMSASKPNAQQYPKDITKLVVPRDGYVIFDADYSQIEYRTLVAMAKEPMLAEMFKDPDTDYHTLMASLMYGVPYAAVTPQMRSDAKSFNFGIPYGMGFKSLAILLTGMCGPTQVAEAKEKYELYFKDQPNVKHFFEQVKEMAEVNKYTKTFWNRYRYYSFVDKDGKFSNARRASALRQAGNAVIQGCVRGDTLIQTKEYGIVQIQDVVDQHLQVWNGTKWTNGDILYSGKKRKCIVTFSTGQRFICSPTHKFLVRSHKGNDRFVECQNIRDKSTGTNPHRVVISQEFCDSDWAYSSNWARGKYHSFSNNANNVFVDDIGDSFKAGVVLGRLASDGSIFLRDIGGSSIRQIIAEHEEIITNDLLEYMDNLNPQYTRNNVRKDRNQAVDWIEVYSKTLTNEIADLDIKHCINKKIFQDTEMLRGFLRGLFDGDGGITGENTIRLVFGNQYNFENMCRDIQKALTFIGIRSRYHRFADRYAIDISTYDNSRFLNYIGFMNPEKHDSAVHIPAKDQHIFGKVLIVESVEITDEYIDMYDVCNTDEGYYVADGIVTHNTAADIFKISVARNFCYIRQNNLLGLVLIVNMVHDEQLFELNCEHLDIQSVFRDIVHNMEFHVDGFPPLYIGAGFGPNWKEAKGKMAEIHPALADQLSREAGNNPIYTDKTRTVQEVLDYFDKRVYEFREQKVADYLMDPKNFKQDIHPVIGSLINLQFTYGLEEEYSGEELLLKAIEEFIKRNNLPVDPENFRKTVEHVEDVEEDSDYDDTDDDDTEDIEEQQEGEFSLIEEDEAFFGVSIQDMIKEFGLVVSRSRKVCGIDITILPLKQKDNLADFLAEHEADENEDGAMQVVFLQESNVLFNTGVYVKGFNGEQLAKKLSLQTVLY